MTLDVQLLRGPERQFYVAGWRRRQAVQRVGTQFDGGDGGHL